MGDIKCRIHLHAVYEIYMKAVFKPENDKRQMPTPIRDPNMTKFQNKRHAFDKKPYIQGHY